MVREEADLMFANNDGEIDQRASRQKAPSFLGNRGREVNLLMASLVLGVLSACVGQGSASPGVNPAAMTASAPAAPTDTNAEDRFGEADPDAILEAKIDSGSHRVKPVQANEGSQNDITMRPFSAVMSSRSDFARMTAMDGTTVPDNALKFHVFSIGQADSMLVIGPPPNNRTLLIDIGELNWNSRRNCLHVRDRIEEITGAARVDYLVVTHYHMDHTGSPRTELRNGRTQEGGGLFCLLDGSPDTFSVGTLIDRGDGESQFKPDRQRIHQAIIDSTSAWTQNGTLQQRVPADFTPGLIDLGPGVTVEVIATAGKVSAGDTGALARAEQASPGTTYSQSTQASPNDFSVGLEISTGDFEFVTAGDLTGAPGDPPYDPAFETQNRQIYTNVESHMVEFWETTGRESDVEIYRVNHHGSRNSSTVDLAEALRPEVIIYSAGGRHRHPDSDIADRFQDLGADQMLTTSADDDEWDDGEFPEEYGNGWLNPVGEIFIHVPIGGDSYTISTEEQSFEYPVFSDAEEAAAANP